MSIELNWETLTTGPDGDALAHSIRDFIHTKFQSVPLPRFIKSVTVHDFEFGTTPPELELKDITDPLPDFYEENPDADDSDSDSDSDGQHTTNTESLAHESRFDDSDPASGVHELRAAAERRRRPGGLGMGPTAARLSALPPHVMTGGIQGGPTMRGMSALPQDLGSPFLGTSTPGIPGGTSNLSYFHSHLTGGLSGTQTPLAAVAGAQQRNTAHGPQYRRQPWSPEEADSNSPQSMSTATAAAFPFPDPAAHHHHLSSSPDGGGARAPSHSRNPSQSSISVMDFNHATTTTPPPALLNAGAYPSNPALREKSSVSTFAPTSASSAGTSRPPTRDRDNSTMVSAAAMLAGSAIVEDDERLDGSSQEKQPKFREPRMEDVQAVFRIRYSGDIKLLLTADILLDYPMPSFVGIPLRLSITGLTFDGVGVVAYIRKRAHFCFLSPEDALAAVGADDEETAGDEGGPSNGRNGNGKMGGLLQEIRVESEIGGREGGKQSLKNVGKVERFVLEQVRRIFEEEFVYPSFWTFLV